MTIYETPKGITIDRAAEEAVVLAKKHMQPVYLEFNGIPLVAGFSSDPQELVQRYWRERDALHEATRSNLFASLVSAELAHAKKHFPPIATRHEAYAVILEEVEEFWAEVKMRDAVPQRMLEELVQIAARCNRAAEDLGLARQLED